MDLDPILYTIQYITFDLNQIPPEITESEELKKYVLLQTQGGSVELIESPKIVLSMFVFNILHRVCREVVFHTNTGKKYSIFDYQPEFAMHPEDISQVLSPKDRFDKADEYPNDVSINLEEIWESLKGQTEEAKLVDALPIIKTKIQRTQVTTLIGDVPLLLLLCAQNLIGNNTQQLFYQRNNSSKARRIK